MFLLRVKQSSYFFCVVNINISKFPFGAYPQRFQDTPATRHTGQVRGTVLLWANDSKTGRYSYKYTGSLLDRGAIVYDFYIFTSTSLRERLITATRCMSGSLASASEKWLEKNTKKPCPSPCLTITHNNKANSHQHLLHVLPVLINNNNNVETHHQAPLC